jgi:hypothetical protein
VRNVSDGQLFGLLPARHPRAVDLDPTAPLTAINGVGAPACRAAAVGRGRYRFQLRDGSEIRWFGLTLTAASPSSRALLCPGRCRSSLRPPESALGRCPVCDRPPGSDREINVHERYCLQTTNHLGVSPPCETKPEPRVPPTSTTTTTAAK